MMMGWKERTFSMGKVDYCRCGRKVNEIEITVRIDKDDDGSERLSVSGALWNARKTDFVYCGQCLDDLKENFPFLESDVLFERLFFLWTDGHLKCLKTGTVNKRMADLFLDESKSDSDIRKILAA